ncbi:response regulator transcription factor [Aciditerrimonas ferrireducens]|jgi:DNA-binding response OmpR family regulator|uniref:response regulator transcription factor n=1 Tax=Aciditerrimonas ferrireducens TaxID=667306 RepID=UPI002004AAEF|nr:response regulator transcription factor [Aciditerrimonas ferrireducens]MCK4177095.1 response regulator transcription factor [Aciditerrimonas ferrireducens]
MDPAAQPRPRATVVLVEDDPAIADLVALYLTREGWALHRATDGETGLELVTSTGADLAVVDVGLPGGLDGFAVVRALAERGVPCLLLTARDEEADRVLGLELGADDYVTKPFSPRELVARCKAILRRAARTEPQRAAPPDPVAAPAPAVLRLGELTVDLRRHEARLRGDPVALTTRELALLAHLLANRGLVLSRRQLLDACWGPAWVGDERTVDVHVAQLRRKLGDALPLATVRGVGYRLDEPPAPGPSGR